MRKLCAFGLVLGVAALLASPALAQPPGGFGRGMGGGGISGLLTNKSVQEELKMDKDQIDKVTDALKKFRDEHKDEYDKLSPRNQDTKPEERAEIGKKLAEGSTKVVSDIIKPEQLKRVQQIAKQQLGVAMFNDAEVQKTLKLTDEQQKDLKALADDLGKDMREVFQSAGQGAFADPEKRAELTKKTTAMRTEAMDKATKMLKDDQKAALKDMLGEKFEVKFEAPRRPQQRN
jgi:hypothetical protein